MQSHFSWLLFLWGKKRSLARQFGAGGNFQPLLHCQNNFVAIKTTVSVTMYLLIIVPWKTHWALLLSHWQRPVACAWTPVKCLLIQYLVKVNKSVPRLHCHFVASKQFAYSTCKSFHASRFPLIIVPYNSVYYNTSLLCNSWLIAAV